MTLSRLPGVSFGGQQFGMGQVGVAQLGLQMLDGLLRFLQGAFSPLTRRPLRLQSGFGGNEAVAGRGRRQPGIPRTPEHHHLNLSVTHKATASTLNVMARRMAANIGLRSTLAGRCRPTKTECPTHHIDFVI
jgi:hypothetical protein